SWSETTLRLYCTRVSAAVLEYQLLYSTGDPCDSAPCQNGATCTRLVRTFVCKCAPGYHGHHCDKVDCLCFIKWGCEHFCANGAERQSCSCADGYRLQRDNASCSPQVRYVHFPCGRPKVFFAPRVVNGQVCPRGYCPWQALLMENDVFICGAVLISPHWVLTAAHCVFSKPGSVFHIIVGKTWEQKRRVVKVLVNPDYNWTSSDSDLALLRLDQDVKLGHFVVPACLPGPREAEVDLTSGLVRTLASVQMSTVSGWGRVAQHGQTSTILQRVTVNSFMILSFQKTGLNVTILNLCFRQRSGPGLVCEGTLGTPGDSLQKTLVLTGSVSWGRGCRSQGPIRCLHRVPNYLSWIHTVMEGGAKVGGLRAKEAGKEQREADPVHVTCPAELGQI
uniref:Peptidase S1 domain-containing protein n=1 Tax=Neogobius melanostomus TaxID=47308 RepID=A0A8C6SJ24_9GOBI